MMPASPVRAGRRRRLAAWGALAALLPLEALALSFRFDGQALAGSDRWELRLLARSGLALRLSVALAAAALLLGGARRIRGLRDRAEAAPPRAATVGFLLAHLAALAGFVALSAALFGDAPDPHPAARLAPAWLAAGAATSLLWAFALLPPRTWAALLWGGRKPLLLAGGLGLAALAVASSTTALWEPLRRATFDAAAGLLALAYPAVVNDPESYVLGTDAFQVRIAPQCSGFEGIGLIWAFLAAYLALQRKALRFPQALLLLPAGTLAMWSANVLRIAALVAIGASGHPAVALGGFHSQSGWLLFNTVALGLVVLTHRRGLFRKADRPRPEAAPEANPTAPYLVPLLALVATSMLTGLLSSGSGDLLYPARVVTVAAALAYYRRSYQSCMWRASWPAVLIGAAVFALWIALEPHAATSRTSPPPAVAALPAPLFAAWVAFRVVGSVLTVPIAEELAFRGYLTRRLIDADFEAVPPGRFSWPAFLISSLLFGALHGRWLAGALAGMAYALAWYRRGSMGDAVVAHAVTNALIAVAVLATRSWNLWA